MKLPKMLDPLPLGYDQVYDECMKRAEKTMLAELDAHIRGKPYYYTTATPWIHLADAVGRGTITVLEALMCFEAGYLLENFKVRESYYSHLL